jgi:hypothetical protein
MMMIYKYYYYDFFFIFIEKICEFELKKKSCALVHIFGINNNNNNNKLNYLK